MNLLKRLGLSLLLWGAGAFSAHASDEFSLFDNDSDIAFTIDKPAPQKSSIRAKKWDFGVDASYMVYARRTNSTALADIDKVDELNEERADLGLVPVASGSKDVIVGKPQNYFEFGGHLYRQITPFMSIGVIGGFGLERQMTLISQGTGIAAPMYAMDFTRQISYVAPSVKMGYWIHRVRPYVSGGLGWYSVRERTQATLVWDPFDDFSPGGPFTTSDTTAHFTGSHFGGGVDLDVGGHAVVGFEFRYHRIFKPGDSINLVSPGIRMSYLF